MSNADGDVLGLLYQPLHARGRHDLALLVVRQVFDVAQNACGTLVGAGAAHHVGHDSPVEEEAVVLERESTSKADLPCDGEGERRETRIVVDAGDRLADLLGCAVLPLNIVRNRHNLPVGLDDLLACAIEHEHRPASRAQELRNLFVAILCVVARCKETHAWHAEVRGKLFVHLRQVGGRARDGNVLARHLAVLEANVARGVCHIIAADADLAILLDDSVEGGGDQRDRVHNPQAGDVDLRPLFDGLICLVDPDIDLFLEVLGSVELLEKLLEEADTL